MSNTNKPAEAESTSSKTTKFNVNAAVFVPNAAAKPFVPSSSPSSAPVLTVS